MKDYINYTNALDGVMLAWTVFLMYIIAVEYVSPVTSAILMGIISVHWYLTGRKVELRKRLS